MSTINSIIKKLTKLKSTYSKIQEEVLDEIAEYAKEQIEKNYQSSEFQEENLDRKTEIKKQKKRRIVATTGSQILYTEFGTGTIGASHPHPEKGKYQLNDYNSGETIRPNKSKDSNASKEGIPLDGLYWTYKDKNGDKVYTQGIPAGMQIYRAEHDTKLKAKIIAKRKVADVLSKL